MHNPLRLFLLAALSIVLVACGTSKKTTSPKAGPGQYAVVRGDTLSKIARQHGQSLQSLMRMNNISNPNKIKVGQVLNVQGGSAAPTAGSSVVQQPTPVTGKSVAAPRSINLTWPAQGPHKRGTTASNSQGVYISGKLGDPVK